MKLEDRARVLIDDRQLSIIREVEVGINFLHARALQKATLSRVFNL
jgi:hypothetical protein